MELLSPKAMLPTNPHQVLPSKENLLVPHSRVPSTFNLTKSQEGYVGTKLEIV